MSIIDIHKQIADAFKVDPPKVYHAATTMTIIRHGAHIRIRKGKCTVIAPSLTSKGRVVERTTGALAAKDAERAAKAHWLIRQAFESPHDLTDARLVWKDRNGMLDTESRDMAQRFMDLPADARAIIAKAITDAELHEAAVSMRFPTEKPNSLSADAEQFDAPAHEDGRVDTNGNHETSPDFDPDDVI